MEVNRNKGRSSIGNELMEFHIDLESVMSSEMLVDGSYPSGRNALKTNSAIFDSSGIFAKVENNSIIGRIFVNEFPSIDEGA